MVQNRARHPQPNTVVWSNNLLHGLGEVQVVLIAGHLERIGDVAAAGSAPKAFAAVVDTRDQIAAHEERRYPASRREAGALPATLRPCPAAHRR